MPNAKNGESAVYTGRERREIMPVIIEIRESDHIAYDRNGMHHTGLEAVFDDGSVWYQFKDTDGNIEYLN